MKPSVASIITRIRAAREGGHVERCHTVPHLGSYSVGKHSFDAVSLLLLLHPEPGPSVNLIKGVLWHDVGERWVGDSPSPAKWFNPAFGEAYEAAEKEALLRSGFYIELTPRETDWLKAVDRLELLLWALDQVAIGNKNVTGMIENLHDYFSRERNSIPTPVLQVIASYFWKRGEEYIGTIQQREMVG